MIVTPAELYQSQAQDLVLALGETVELSAGDDPVTITGIFDPIGPRPDAWASEVGLTGRLSAQTNPMLHVRSADAELLHEKDVIIIRETAYIVVSMTPHGDGMTECALMLASASATDALARYR